MIGFNLTDAQYDETIKHLKEGYDDREFIIHEHYTALHNIPKCSNSTTELRKQFNFIEIQLRSKSVE